MAKMIRLLLLSSLTILTINGNTLTEPQDDWCSVCTCTSSDDSMTLSCAKNWFPEFPQTWPEQFVEEKNSTDKTLVVAFRFIEMTKLQPLPEIKVKKVALSLQNCRLVEISNAAFKNIKNIYFLSLAFNKLTGDAVRGDIFKGPYDNRLYEPIDLEVLHLESNLIHSLDRKMFEHTPKLRSLYLFNNPFGVLDDVTILALASIKTLEVLDLSYTEISYLPVDILRSSKSLRELRLSGNKFTTIPESLGSIASSLTFLTINKNLIEEINDNSFLGLWRLEHLEVGAMETLKRVKAGAFAQLLSLKVLHMSHNRNLREIDHDAFRELKLHWPIQELYIQDNNLGTLPDDLAPWDQLYSINLDYNAWICDCKMAKTITTKGVGKKIPRNSSPRCTTPIETSGLKLIQLNPDILCTSKERNFTTGPSRYHSMRNLSHRPGSVLIALGFVCAVVILGLSLGCLVSCVRNRLKKVTFVQPVSVSSNIFNTSE